jgi:methylthioribose-1-phosphate isomerase
LQREKQQLQEELEQLQQGRSELVELVVALDDAKAAASAGKEQQQPQQQAQQEVEQLQLDKQQLQEQLIITGYNSLLHTRGSPVRPLSPLDECRRHSN